MKINIYYWNNGVGVVADSILLKNTLFQFDVVVYDVSKNNEYRKGDVGIFVQDIWADYFYYNKKNIYVINEEWLTSSELSYFNHFDQIIVKSNHAKELLKSYHPHVTNTGFFSLNRYNNPNITGNIIHFKGKSIQKNHELAFKYKNKYDINIIDSEVNYLSNDDVTHQLNNHDIHICCSLYEGWGHYLWEAMSCGKLVICSEIPAFKEYLDSELVKFVPVNKVVKFDPDHQFLNNTKYLFREGYFVDEFKFKELLENKKELLEFQKNNSDKIRKFFLDVNIKNKNKLLNFIEFVI